MAWCNKSLYKNIFDVLVKEGRFVAQLLPCLAVLTRKADGRRQVRVVACGNFERSAGDSNYASPVESSFWRQISNITVQARGSCGSVDVSEAFSQSEPSDNDQGVYWRLPSQWKERFLFPSVLTEFDRSS